MKTKEFIALYRKERGEDVSLEAITRAATKLIQTMFTDAIERGKQRSGGMMPNDRVLIPIVREIDQQWRGIAREFPELDPDGLRNFWKTRGIEI